MKKMLLSLCMTAFTAAITNAQTNTFPTTGSAGIGTISPNGSAILEMQSTTKGMLAPRMTLAQRNAIASPVNGLLIYQTNNTPGFYYYNGTNWVAVAPKSATRTLSNLDTTAINLSLLPAANNTIDLGSSSLNWNEVYVNSIKFMDGTTLSTGAGGAETDPQVGANTTSFIPRWDGTALVKGLIQDNGSRIGINKAPDTEHRLSVLRQATSGITTAIYSAVRGENNAAASSTINSAGYLGVDNPSGMYPIVFPNSSFDDIGVMGIKHSTSTNEGAGLYGWNQGGAGSNYGIFGTSTSSTGLNYGMYGKTITSNSGINYAVYGEAQGSNGNYGVYGKVTTASGQFGYAVFGSASGAGTNYAGYFAGRVRVSDHLLIGTSTDNAVLNIGGDNRTVEIDGTNPWLQMKSVGNDVGYIRANVSNFEVGTNAGTVGNLVLRTNGGDRMTIGSNGRVGVNTVITPAQFNVVGTNETVNINGSNPYLQINNGGALTGYIRANGSNFQVATNAENDNGKLEFRTNGSSRMWIDASGNVSVGGSGKVATGYLLSVVGKVMAEEVRVELNGTWPDYVFAKDYKLMPLQNLKQYVNENNHLPEVPAAEDMKAGIEVGKMNKMLMQKVEELTLYVIQLNEEIQALKNQHK